MEVTVFSSASEAFNQRNINCSIDESLDRFRPVLALAREDEVRVPVTHARVIKAPLQP